MPDATFVLFYEEALGEGVGWQMTNESPEKLWGLLVGELDDGEWMVVDDGAAHHAVSKQQVVEKWTGEWRRS